MYCSKCGKEILGESRFCTGCGTEIMYEIRQEQRAKSGDLTSYYQLGFWALVFMVPAGIISLILVWFSKVAQEYARERILVFSKIISVLSIIIGIVVYANAVINYSHCSEALICSIIGWITAVFMGGF